MAKQKGNEPGKEERAARCGPLCVVQLERDITDHQGTDSDHQGDGVGSVRGTSKCFFNSVS